MFRYIWKLTDLKQVEQNNYSVFSCFACGGGSTMGYKMEGYNVIGINEIDKQMVDVYRQNFYPKYVFQEGIQTFKKRTDIPQELFSLDILDGSPPCSTFSMAGKREEGWGKNKKFREGQSKQILSDLFFDYIELTKKLQPKVVLAENVKGMLAGNAKGYTKQILTSFQEAGYRMQIFLLNAASMGVPQKRERVFFIGLRNDIKLPKLKLSFQEKPILFGEIYQQGDYERRLQPKETILWNNRQRGERSLVEANQRLYGKSGYFKSVLIRKDRVCNTIIAGDALVLQDEPRHLSTKEMIAVGSFPQDYNFGKVRPEYLIGMSVPPLMIARVAEQIKLQWLIPYGKS